MVRLGAQSQAVSPALRRKRRGEVSTIYSMRGQATKDVLARKTREREQAAMEATETDRAATLNLGKQKLALQKKQDKAATRAGQIGTGISMGTLGMNLMGAKGGTLGNKTSVPFTNITGSGTWGQGLGAAAMGAGVGQMVNTSKKWKKAAVGGTVGGVLGLMGGGALGGTLGGFGGALGGFL